MTFIFKDFLSKFFKSMSQCCAPTTDVTDLRLQSPQESKLRDMAKMSVLPDAETVDDDVNISPSDTYRYNLNISDRDLLLIIGFLHTIKIVSFDIKPIINLCINYYYNNLIEYNYIYLLSEHCTENTFPSLDDSDNDDDNGHLFNNYGMYITETNNTKNKYCG
eukprot:255866_1